MHYIAIQSQKSPLTGTFGESQFLKEAWIRNVGKMDPKSKRVGTGLVGAPACGDVMKLQIEVGLVEDIFVV